MKTKETIATFNDLDKAEKVRDRLAQAGIPAEVMDESKLQRFWFMSKPLAGEKVFVDEKDFERAREVLQGVDAQEHVLQGEVRCPQCGSADIQYPQFTRKFIMTTFVEILCFLHMLDKEFYCIKCHHSWPVQRDLRARTDILNWPAKDKGMVANEKG